MSDVKFRTAGLPDVETMLEWAAAEGWNPGLDDAAAFLSADPEGFFVAEFGNVAVAAISVVNHSASFAFLGFYICSPEFRGRGIGYGLWRHALAHAGGRTVGLDGVADQEANYARSGFERAGASIRFEGALSATQDATVREAEARDLVAISALDSSACGFERPAFLSAWTTPATSRATLVLEGAGGLEGFATVRRCREGVKIGPVVAPNADAALTLARAALIRIPAEKAIIDVPSSNRELITSLDAHGFSETFATARMYRGPAPATGSGLQAIGTMELG